MSGATIKGSWSEAEDNQLRTLYQENHQNWSLIAATMAGRTAKQCRERWVQNLRPELIHGSMTEKESTFILDCVNSIGQKWAEIARRLQSAGISVRSDNAVKNWYNGTVNRQKRSLARHNRQSTTAARGRAPAPLNLNVTQRPLPAPMGSGQRTPTTPVHNDYVYGSQQQQQQHQHQPQYHQHQHYYSPTESHHRHAAYDDRSSAAAAYAPGPQLAPLNDTIARDHRSNESHYYQQQQQQQQPMATSSSYYQYPAARYADRRSSVYTIMGSPRSDAYEHLSAPSLVSDAGSPPSARESPMNAPVSPSTTIPPMSSLPGFAPNEKEMAALHAQSFRSASSSMDRSWSSRSDEHCITLPPAQAQPQSQHMAHRRLPPPAPIEPSIRPSSSGRAMDVNSLLNRF